MSINQSTYNCPAGRRFNLDRHQIGMSDFLRWNPHQAHLEHAEPALICFNTVGYLIKDGYIDADPVLATHWITIWRCWMRSRPLVNWAAEKRGYRDHLKMARFLFAEAEKYRLRRGYPEPSFYDIPSSKRDPS